MNSAAPAFLSDSSPEILFFGGKGGVGKTTCACAAALALARAHPECSHALVSTDPAHSLADSLAGSPPPANLKVIELDAQECLDAFKSRHGAALRAIALSGTFLDEKDVSGLFDLALPGMDELTAVLEISRWVRGDAYRRIVVDTAPTGHTLKLLALPGLLRKWLEAVDALLAKHRYMRAVFRRSGQVRDLTDDLVEELAGSLDALETLLRDGKRCRFVPVMLAEEMSLTETRRLLKELARAGFAVREAVVNRVVPASGCPACAGVRAGQMEVLKKLRGAKDFSGMDVWTLPLSRDEVRGVERLGALLEAARPLAEEMAQVYPGAAGADAAIRVEGDRLPPPTGRSLLLFAGKGGVGKTTLSSAAALRLAEEMPGSPVLLFSTDPAHALSSCLGLRLKKGPTQVSGNLWALEIDADAEFGALKKLYAAELKTMLGKMLPGMDPKFDREAMEKLMDLAPPGLDEVMALVKVVDLEQSGQYHVLVLDTAPTGHLLRLLEMPELLETWLKTFFGILLKYPTLFRMPKLSQRLVDLSKSLKNLRAMLADEKRTALSVVTIPTEMACLETQDLVAACRRLNVPVSSMLINLLTPEGDCPLCNALRTREAAAVKRYAELFPKIPQTLVYRTGGLRGTDNLRKLSHSLYAHH